MRVDSASSVKPIASSTSHERETSQIRAPIGQQPTDVNHQGVPVGNLSRPAMGANPVRMAYRHRAVRAETEETYMIHPIIRQIRSRHFLMNLTIHRNKPNVRRPINRTSKRRTHK
jgi:hypothetical protein